MDILLDLIRVLRPRATLFGGGLDAVGRWGLSFRKRDDLLSCWVERGECQLVRPLCAPLLIGQGDFVLIRTSTPFTLTSDSSVEPADSETAVSTAGRMRVKLGSGEDRPVTLHAGKFVVETANEDLLAGLLPQLVHITASDPSLGRVRALLAMNEMEARHPGPASEFVIVRLVELILVEILRTDHLRKSEENKGCSPDWLTWSQSVPSPPCIGTSHAAGLLRSLAKLCGVSRSTFATRFSKVVGVGPIEYLLHWRMALAKDELRYGTKSIGEIAFATGFGSSSAFSSAFTREVGCPPTHFGRRGS